MDFTELTSELDKTKAHLKEEMAQIRTGRATTELIEGVKVNAYDTVAPLTNYGNISVSDAKSLTVQAWDPSIKENIAKAIEDAQLGLGVMIDGEVIRVTVPDMTAERRKDLVKIMKDRVETSRIAVRNIRRKFMDKVKELADEGIAKDDEKRFQEEIEKQIKATNEEIEQMKDTKEQDLMTI